MVRGAGNWNAFGVRGAVTCFLLTIAAACGSSTETPADSTHPSGSPKSNVLAISPSTQHIPPTVDEVLAAYDAPISIGARGFFASYRWSELEATPGHIDVSPLRGTLQTAIGKGYTKILVGIQIINTNQKETPTDLRAVAFDSSLTIARFHALLDQIIPLLGTQVAYLSIGNEVDAYLGPTNQWSAYRTFFEDARSYVKQRVPGLAVGVTTILDGARGPWKSQVQSLSTNADIAIFTYYGQDSQFHALPASSAVTALTDMLTLANGKPVVVQEFGQPSAASLGGSEALQADFFSQGFGAWNAHAAQIPFLNIFSLYDLPPAICDQLLAYYGAPGQTAFRDYLCSLGLRRQDGGNKTSWTTVATVSKQIGLP